MSYHPNIGDILLTKYEIVSLLGEGAFGCVYCARDIKLNRKVAIKFINPINEMLSRFMGELDAIKLLEHPNIVRLYDYDILKGGVPCIVMEYVNGRELGDILATQGTFYCEDICSIALQILDALVETHQQNIIHCDLKPENIMLTKVGARQNVVKLIDFGVASIISKSSSARDNMLVGTPQYMAPEQILHQPIGPWTDIYALGLILIELFTGNFVFDDPDPRQVLRMQLYNPVKIPHQLACSELGAIISRATEKDASKRYQSTIELYNDVKEASANMQTVVRQHVVKPSVAIPRNHAVNSIFADLDTMIQIDAQTKGSLTATGATSRIPLLSSGQPSSTSPADGALHWNGQNPEKFSSSYNNMNESDFDALRTSIDSIVTPILDVENLAQTQTVHVPVLEKAALKPSGGKISSPSASGGISEDGLKRIEQAAQLSKNSRPTQPVHMVDNDCLVVTHHAPFSNRNIERTSKNHSVVLLFALLLVLVATGAYMWFSGIFADLGLIKGSSKTVTAQERQENAIEKKTFIQYSTRRQIADDMAYVAAISGYMGALTEPSRYKTYKIIGTPTDAGIYINDALVCRSTPCSVHIFGNPEKSKIEIRKGRKHNQIAILKDQSTEEPIFIVLKK